jgi:thioredoxin reductase (NADPH)
MLKDVVIIGAGPSGISFAVEAINRGVLKDNVVILEKENNHNFSIRKYYPENKLVTANYKGVIAKRTGILYLEDCTKQETLDYFDRIIHEYQLNIFYKNRVKAIVKMKNGFYRVESDRDSIVTRVVIIASGILGKPNSPGYKIPETIKNKIYYAIPKKGLVNQKILVVGGGDSASEYTQHLANANKVTISYRRDTFYRMTDRNKELIEKLITEQKVRASMNSDIVCIENSNDRIKVVFKDQDPEVFDGILYAIGGADPKEFLNSLGIDMRGNQYVSDVYESTSTGVFIIGDLSAGNSGGSINFSFNQAKLAMEEVCDNYLDCPPAI